MNKRAEEDFLGVVSGEGVCCRATGAPSLFLLRWKTEPLEGMRDKLPVVKFLSGGHALCNVLGSDSARESRESVTHLDLCSSGRGTLVFSWLSGDLWGMS